MPVGSSDRGVGLWAGQVMFGFDNSNEYIDWWHDVLPGSQENFDHEGRMVSGIFTPNLTVGLSNYVNISFSQTIGFRHLIWDGNQSSVHHRTEGTSKSRFNAIGGLLGDHKVMIRYLVSNAGKGSGSRFFLGGGFSLPSKNTLISDPFFLTDKNKMEEHRHFSMSDGCYKLIGETQFYLKRKLNPVFVGGAFLVQAPLEENKYGYRSSTLYDLSLTAITNEHGFLKRSLNFNLGLMHTTHGYWNGIAAPNSRATVVTFGAGVLRNTDFGVVTVGLLKPVFVYGGFSGTDGEVDSRVDAWRLNVGFRRLFDYVIPWLDPLKNL